MVGIQRNGIRRHHFKTPYILFSLLESQELGIGAMHRKFPQENPPHRCIRKA